MESAALSFSGRKCAGMEPILSGLHEECGVFGVYDPKGGCAQTTYYGLYALQHRGQEACGIAAINGREQSFYKDVGLVSEVFDKETLDRLNGTMAVGHVRYATTGAGERENAQPLTIKYVKGTLAVVHNGNLVGVDQLRRDFEYKGAIFHTTSDSELIAYAIAQARLHCRSVEDAVCYAARNLKGAFSLLVMSPRKLIACRDPWGFRPLCMGRKGDAVLFASESCAIASVGGELERELEPGEIVVVEDGQVRSIRDNCRGLSHMCIFEYIYFARPDSVIAGQSVHQARVNAGKLLAQEHPVEADLVIGVPDSGLDAAQGYAQESGIPYGVGFVKNRYVGRTFITPDQASREQAVRIKLAALAARWRASGWSWWTTPSSGGPPAARSSPCCGRRGPKRSICASPRPPSSPPATSAPTSPTRTGSSHAATRWRRSGSSPGRTAWATSPWSTSTSWPPTPGAASATAASPSATPFRSDGPAYKKRPHSTCGRFLCKRRLRPSWNGVSHRKPICM